MGEFVGRERELGLLREEFDAPSPTLAIAYGRRRVGKSRLLQEASKGRPHVYFQATLATSNVNIENFKTTIVQAIGASEILNGLGTWEGILHYLADAAKDHPSLIVIIDEFPYLIEDDKSLPSVIQRFWDTKAVEKGNLKIVLCGSAISQMEDLLSAMNPLYGRNTMLLDVKQLPLRDVAKFFPAYTAEDAIKTYAVFGGIPHYLALCRPDRPLRQNIIDLLMKETGALIEEPEFLLKTELDKPKVYSGILAAIAGGCSSTGTIAGRLQVQPPSLGPYLSKLMRLDLITSEKSLHADDRARNRRLRLNDQLLAFWYRFVEPNRSAIASGFGEQVYDTIVDRDFSMFMGSAFETVCREYARRHLDEITGVPANEVGALWGFPDFDIDVAGTLLDRTPFFGEAKWQSARIDMGMVETLKLRADKSGYGGKTSGKQFLFFSRNGFKPEVEARAKADASIKLITPEMLVHPSALAYRDDMDEDTESGPPGPRS